MFCLNYITFIIPEANSLCDALHYGYIRNCFQNLKCKNFRSTGSLKRERERARERERERGKG